MERIYTGIVVGCGNIGALFERESDRPKPASHAGALVANEMTELSALVDSDTDKLTAASLLFPGIPTYFDLASCFSERIPDIVIIATPPSSHLSLIKESVAQGVSMIVCEKPLAQTVAEAREIKALLADSATILVLNYQRRFYPLFEQVRLNIKEGMLGEIQQITCYYSNGLRTNGSHAVDAVSYLLADTFESGVAVPNEKNLTCPESDANIDAILKTSKGVNVVLQSFDQQAFGIHDLRIFGTKSSVTLTEYGLRLERSTPEPSRFLGINQLVQKDDARETDLVSATSGALSEVLRCMHENQVPISGVENGIEALEVVESLIRSAGEGRMVTLHGTS